MKKGLTFIEMITVLALLGIGTAMFFSVFLVNYMAFDERTTKLELWNQANSIIDDISFFVRPATNITVLNNGAVQQDGQRGDSINIVYGGGDLSFRFVNDRLDLVQGNKVIKSYRGLTPGGSYFIIDPNTDNLLRIYLSLEDITILGKTNVVIDTNIYFRNI